MSILYEPAWHLLVVYVIGFLVTTFICSILMDVDFDHDDDTGRAILVSIFWPLVAVLTLPIAAFIGITDAGGNIKRKRETKRIRALEAKERQEYEARTKEREDQVNALNARHDDSLTWE